MSLKSEMISAAAEAQSVLAELGGALPGQKNSLFNGTAYVATYGTPQVENQMLPGGGYRGRTVVLVTATRAQFTAPPIAKQKWTRTDLPSPLTYTIDWVGYHDATVYFLRLVRTGE